MINRNKLEHILEYARQQRYIGQSCKVSPENMVEIMERLLNAGNSLVIPEGYVMVPKEPTKEMIDAGWLYYMGTKNPSSKGTYKAMLAAAPQPQNAPQNIPEIIPGWIPVSERMPDEGETVLGCCGLNGRHSGIYTMRASVIHRKNSAIDTYGIKHERVTHWMPLPAAPQEVNHG